MLEAFVRIDDSLLRDAEGSIFFGPAISGHLLQLPVNLLDLLLICSFLRLPRCHVPWHLLLCGPATFASAAAAFEIVPRMNFLPIFLPTFDCSPAVNIRDLLPLVFQ